MKERKIEFIYIIRTISAQITVRQVLLNKFPVFDDFRRCLLLEKSNITIVKNFIILIVYGEKLRFLNAQNFLFLTK